MWLEILNKRNAILIFIRELDRNEELLPTRTFVIFTSAK